ncbi:Slp family lipoprotein [Pseudoxanthomonas sp. SL93]|jgi:outer membrane lipoprotein|uniref:Slp family lipoprotein n=1 Tax=Pseudoxanthomonas sp. SL93 TaxID=2995142 RepID=UPI00226EE45A|nr:Slp family lipoprotein [Pseudoxanthomonas sp. SL93]WAC64481.1 Slp family lipoprotein [Pseudoxanthomonas sp. SL93]
MNLRIVLLAAAAATLAACATAPKPLQGSFTPVNPRDSVAAPQVGAPVRWGGRIISTTPAQNSTCFQLVSRPLSGTGRPLSSAPDATDGRFIACRAGFYDPAVFTEGREVTFVGRIEGYESTRIGEYDYQLPRMAADVVYLWPEVREVDVVYPYYRDPFYWGPRWGWWGW